MRTIKIEMSYSVPQSAHGNKRWMLWEEIIWIMTLPHCIHTFQVILTYLLELLPSPVSEIGRHSCLLVRFLKYDWISFPRQRSSRVFISTSTKDALSYISLRCHCTLAEGCGKQGCCLPGVKVFASFMRIC